MKLCKSRLAFYIKNNCHEAVTNSQKVKNSSLLSKFLNDFDACFTDGENIEEVIINAKDVLEGTIFSLLKNSLEVPEPTLTKPNLENNEFLVYIDICLPHYR